MSDDREPRTRKTLTIKGDDLRAALGEGFHTAFRKAADSAEATVIHRLIGDMQPEEWSAVIDFVTNGVAHCGDVEDEDPRIAIQRLLNEVYRADSEVGYYENRVEAARLERRRCDRRVLALMKKVEAEEHSPEWWKEFFGGQEDAVAASTTRAGVKK